MAGIRETARTDPDKLQVLVARLEELLEDYHERDAELTPGWGRFEAILDAIKRTVWRGDAEPKLGMDAEQWRDRLGELTERARTAYADHDQDGWSKAFNQAQATWESLAQDEYRFVRSDPEEYVRRMYGALQERAQELREQLDGYNLAENPETRQLQEQRLRELKTELGSKLEGPLRQLDPDRLKPAQARQEIDRLQETISYFERQLDKLPTLGLVRK